jgi:hypothetical protein
MDRNWMLVRVTRGPGRHEYAEYERIGVVYRDSPPDDEAFLARLFQQFKSVEDRCRQGTYYLTPDEMGAVFTDAKGG